MFCYRYFCFGIDCVLLLASLGFRAVVSLSFSVPLSTIPFPVPWFCVVFRVFVCALFLCVVFRDLLVFPAFQSSTFPLVGFFSSLFCVCFVFLGFPWLVGFFGLLVRLYIGSGSQFRFRRHLSPECYILLQLQNPTYRCWFCLLAVSASVGTGVLLLCILFVFTEIALVQSGSHLC